MHRPIRERLEEYLSGADDSRQHREVDEHLAACRRCREAVEQMRRQSRLLRTLRSPEEAEPMPGFYARVVERIESQAASSFWGLFLEPAFARRLAYASLALLVVLSALIISGLNQDMTTVAAEPYTPEIILAEEPVSPYIGDDIQRDREVVLVNLATYQY